MKLPDLTKEIYTNKTKNVLLKNRKYFSFQRRATAKLSTEKQDPIGVHDRGSDVWRTISLAQSGFHRVGLRLHFD